MKVPRSLPMMVLVPLLLMASSSYYAPANSTTIDQKERTSRPEKQTQDVEYVCPMHSNVTSKSRGTCPKCNMELVKKKSEKVTAMSPY